MTRHVFNILTLGCLWLVGCQDDILIESDASAWRVSSDMNARSDMDVPDDLLDMPGQGDDASSPVEDMHEADVGLSCPPVPGDLCMAQDPTAWAGECEDRLGAFFDGTRCREAVGCSCETPEDCPAFGSMERCAKACGRAGSCNADVLPWITSEPRAMCAIRSCIDGIAVCVEGEDDPTERLNQRLTRANNFLCQPPTMNSICEFRLEIDCNQSWCCTSQPDDGFEERLELEQLCGLSLYPDILGVRCINLE